MYQISTFLLSDLYVLNKLGTTCHQRNKLYDAMNPYKKDIQMRKCNHSEMIHLRPPFLGMKQPKTCPRDVAMDNEESVLIGMNMFSTTLQLQQGHKDISKPTCIQGLSIEIEVLALVTFNVALVHIDHRYNDKAINFLI